MKVEKRFTVIVVQSDTDGCGNRVEPITAGQVRSAVAKVAPLASVTADEYWRAEK